MDGDSEMLDFCVPFLQTFDFTPVHLQQSYLQVAFFSTLQAVALLYYLFSYFPGGTSGELFSLQQHLVVAIIN